MFFANESSDALQKANPYFEIGIATLFLLSGGLFALEFYLQHRKKGTSWTKKEARIRLLPLGAGAIFLFIYFIS